VTDDNYSRNRSYYTRTAPVLEFDVAIVEPGPYATNIGNVIVQPDDAECLLGARGILKASIATAAAFIVRASRRARRAQLAFPDRPLRFVINLRSRDISGAKKRCRSRRPTTNRAAVDANRRTAESDETVIFDIAHMVAAMKADRMQRYETRHTDLVVYGPTREPGSERSQNVERTACESRRPASSAAATQSAAALRARESLFLGHKD
jgi:hypothetical protein